MPVFDPCRTLATLHLRTKAPSHSRAKPFVTGVAPVIHVAVGQPRRRSVGLGAVPVRAFSPVFTRKSFRVQHRLLTLDSHTRPLQTKARTLT